jgi:tetraprenyl-beta-curcumene synthase
MGSSAPLRPVLAAAFLRAGAVYSLIVLPEVRRQLRRWRQYALGIPDPILRRTALETQQDDRGNPVGAATFATFVPWRMRPTVITGLVAFQTAFDYVDSLAEQPSDDGAANGQALHQALEIAFRPESAHRDYYAHHAQHDDGGYLSELVDTCRSALGALPSYDVVRARLQEIVPLMVTYQSLIHAQPTDGIALLAEWGRECAPLGSDLRWWEAAAASTSPLIAFALIAAAARPSMTMLEVTAIEDAYVPWTGALHVLLDSLIDEGDDLAAGRVSLVGQYRSSQERTQRMGTIAERARDAAEALPDSQHRLLLNAMCSYYLSLPSAWEPRAAGAAGQVRQAIGGEGGPIRLILRLRRIVARRRLRSVRPTPTRESSVTPL